MQAALALPPFPTGLTHVWNCYRRLRSRQGSGFSANPISWEAIDAFLRRAGIRLAPYEIQIIEAVDDVYLAGRDKKPGKAAPQVAAREMTEELFDALFK